MQAKEDEVGLYQTVRITPLRIPSPSDSLHGEEAIPLLWQDVAKADLKRAPAKTFARALSKRYRDNLNKLIATAESAPIPNISKPK